MRRSLLVKRTDLPQPDVQPTTTRHVIETPPLDPYQRARLAMIIRDTRANHGHFEIDYKQYRPSRHGEDLPDFDRLTVPPEVSPHLMRSLTAAIRERGIPAQLELGAEFVEVEV